MPQVPIFLRHPEVPAHHTTAIAACTCVRGPRRMAARNCSLPYSALPRPSPFEARPAEEAGLAPQGDGKSESLAAAGSTVTLSKDALRSILALADFGEHLPGRLAGKADGLRHLGQVGAQERVRRLL